VRIGLEIAKGSGHDDVVDVLRDWTIRRQKTCEKVSKAQVGVAET